MEKVFADAFIQKFEPYYFNHENRDPSINKRAKIIRKDFLDFWDIYKLNGTDKDAEDFVVEHLLKKGVYCTASLAWKAGKVYWNDNSLGFKDSFKNGEDYSIGERGKPLSKKEFDDYLRLLIEKKDVINEFINTKKFQEAYQIALMISDDQSQTPKYFGPVNIINALFFVSCGKAPIYDSFAHKAVRALAMNIAPQSVFMGANPDITETRSVLRMYNEYMCLLKKLFPEYVNKHGNDEFIPRELDRALWVYGHCGREWRPND